LEPDTRSSEPKVRRVLETGEKIGEGNRKSVYHSEEVDGMEDSVVKVFGTETADQVWHRVRNADEEYFPETEFGMSDLSEVEIADDYGSDAVVVVQDRSDESIVDSDMVYEEAVDRTVSLTDRMIGDGHIIDDFKLEALHLYDDELKLVDFEDSRSTRSFPTDDDVIETADNEDYRSACMYAKLAKGLSEEYGVGLQAVMDDVAEISGEIDDEVYSNKQKFSADMVNYYSM
jgi:hypothetical protein